MIYGSYGREPKEVENNLIEITKSFVTPAGVQIMEGSRIFYNNNCANLLVVSNMGKKVADSLGSIVDANTDKPYTGVYKRRW